MSSGQKRFVQRGDHPAAGALGRLLEASRELASADAAHLLELGRRGVADVGKLAEGVRPGLPGRTGGSVATHQARESDRTDAGHHRQRDPRIALG